MTTTPERHLIKKYANRKLYDTRTSRYNTLEGIAELVRDGHEIKVVDRDNGHDRATVAETVAIWEEARSKRKRRSWHRSLLLKRDEGLWL